MCKHQMEVRVGRCLSEVLYCSIFSFLFCIFEHFVVVYVADCCTPGDFPGQMTICLSFIVWLGRHIFQVVRLCSS